MAIPVLLTVGALGAGFVVLSRKRAEMSKAQAGNTGAVAVAMGAEDVGAALHTQNGQPIGDNGIAGTTGGVTPGFTSPVSGAPAIGESLGNLGGSDPSTLPSVQATAIGGGHELDVPDMTIRRFDTAAAYYGNTTGLTRQQLALAQAEVGALVGEVW